MADLPLTTSPQDPDLTDARTAALSGRRNSDARYPP